ncbi:MAG: acyl-CoA thioesterase II [Pseudomonadales bacterium]|nr:acyl-CoA thioesterase II [Pseudomonadales bacterium]
MHEFERELSSYRSIYLNRRILIVSDLPPKLLNLLDLEQIEVNIFRGRSHKTGAPQVFGGQVLGQALLSASKTVEGFSTHSLHAYFLRGGDMNAPILYEVERIRDGRSFCTRRVVAIQHGRPIFNMSASFQVSEDGLEHQLEMPPVPRPDKLTDDRSIKKTILEKKGKTFNPFISPDWPLDIRRCEETLPTSNPKVMPAIQNTWFRIRETLPDDQTIHKAALAYASDLNLLTTAMLPHGISFMQPDVRLASLDHAMWFHRPIDCNQWMLYATESPSSSGGRGFNRGNIFNIEGELIASSCQEGLMRKLPLK